MVMAIIQRRQMLAGQQPLPHYE